MSRVTKELFATPGGDAIDASASLEGADLEAVYWEYHGIKDEIARKERFWASTNHALEDAYKELAQRTEELRVAQGRIVELEKQRTEQLMAGGFAADHDASSKLECRFVFSPHANIIGVAVVFAVFDVGRGGG